MLIKFYSKVGGFTMFGDVGLKLLKGMGHSGELPGAIRPEDIPQAVARLKGKVAESGAEPSGSDEIDPDEPVPVTLSQRAFPLIELLERAAAEDCEVLWKQG
jgi:hypothetical protein